MQLICSDMAGEYVKDFVLSSWMILLLWQLCCRDSESVLHHLHLSFLVVNAWAYTFGKYDNAWYSKQCSRFLLCRYSTSTFYDQFFLFCFQTTMLMLLAYAMIIQRCDVYVQLQSCMSLLCESATFSHRLS